MKKSIGRFLCEPLIWYVGLSLLFFWKFFFLGKIPIPADTLLGMYHPWRDVVWDGKTAGYPYKNALITDPVRQQFEWRSLAISQLKKGNLPIWNPYSFSGTPHLANLQTAAFYPLNLLFFVLQFPLAWAIQIVLQPFLGAVFLYAYMRFQGSSKTGSFISGLLFGWGGFSIAWLTWNTVVQVLIWLPLILLAKEHILQQFSKRWFILLVFAECSSFLAGHLQIFVYSAVFSTVYLLLRILQVSYRSHRWDWNGLLKKRIIFLCSAVLVIFITSIQWFPTVQFILGSSRIVDQGSWLKEGWFIPLSHLVMFIAPDFFGNPATGNYWGVWNYGEFIGYVSIAGLVLALIGFTVKRKTTAFFVFFLLLALIFSTDNPIARLPFIFSVPLISTSQPTRLISIAGFCLAILAGFGLDRLQKVKKFQEVLLPLIIPAVLITAWISVFNQMPKKVIPHEYLEIAKRNLIVPTFLTVIIFCLILLRLFINKKRLMNQLLHVSLVVLIFIDLFRFGWKFTPFVSPSLIFPKVDILTQLHDLAGFNRVMALDRRILPPNSSIMYELYDTAGYDPLYSSDYNRLVSSWNGGSKVNSLSAFNRIVTPERFDSPITNLLGVRFVLSLTQLNHPHLKLVRHVGETFIYENSAGLDRAYFATSVINVSNYEDQLEGLFSDPLVLKGAIYVSGDLPGFSKPAALSDVKITSYEPNKIVITVSSDKGGLVVLTDPYDVHWRAFIQNTEYKIHRVNYFFRGIMVPAGYHMVVFKSYLL